MLERAAGALEKRGADRRGKHAVGPPFEQGDAELGFELGDRLRHRRLRQVLALGGEADRSAAGHFAADAQMADIRQFGRQAVGPHGNYSQSL